MSDRSAPPAVPAAGPTERPGPARQPGPARPLLAGTGLRVRFPVDRRMLRALDGVDIAVHRGETVALVGESGSGKSTAARTLMRVQPPDEGRVTFDGTDITDVSEKALFGVRRRLQMVFQDPYGSLDPHMTVASIVGEPLRTHERIARGKLRQRVSSILTDVGLGADVLDRRPSEFSGGQRQRIAIARALILDPDVLVADEPVSALDVSIQAQIINLLASIQASRSIAYLIIAHDLALVNQISDRIVVMYLGRVVEEGPTASVVTKPLHPYTAALLSASPNLDHGRTDRIVLRGDPPSAIDRPTGCHFHPRCPIARPKCAVEDPALSTRVDGRRVACFFPGELPGAGPAEASPPTS